MRVSSIFLFSTVLIISWNCKEVPPPVDLATPVGEFTTYIESTIETPQNKVVLIEEFSGASCTNCPQGHDALDNIISTHGEQVAVVSLHAGGCGPLVDPVPGDIIDLRSDDADDIIELIGDCGGIPAAMFDRVLYNNEEDEIINGGVTNWNSFVNTNLSNPAPLNLYLTKNYDATSKKLTVDIELHYTSEVLEDNSLTVMLTESGIITQQKLSNGSTDYDYEQNHVLRSIITPSTGQLIPTEKEAGRVLITQIESTLDASWNPDMMEIVAFIHNSSSNLEVLQAAHVKVK